MDIAITDVALVIPGGGIAADARIEVAGKLELPVRLVSQNVQGDGQLFFEIPKGVIRWSIDLQGKVHLAQATLGATGTWHVNLFEDIVSVDIEDPQLKVNLDQEWVEFRSKLTFPDFNGAVCDLSGANYVRIQRVAGADPEGRSRSGGSDSHPQAGRD